MPAPATYSRCGPIGRIVIECIDDAVANPPRLTPCSEDFSVIGTSARLVSRSEGRS